jgi:hypothetical protein
MVERAAALPPATGVSEDLFSVDGGPVLLTGLYGYFTVAAPAQTLSFDLALDPDDGGADVVLATALSINALAAGRYLRLNPTAGGVLVATLNVTYGAKLAVPIVLDPGDIKLNVTGGGAIGTTCRVRWGMWWVPLDSTPATAVTAT